MIQILLTAGSLITLSAAIKLICISGIAYQVFFLKTIKKNLLISVMQLLILFTLIDMTTGIWKFDYFIRGILPIILTYIGFFLTLDYIEKIGRSTNLEIYLILFLISWYGIFSYVGWQVNYQSVGILIAALFTISIRSTFFQIVLIVITGSRSALIFYVARLFQYNKLFFTILIFTILISLFFVAPSENGNILNRVKSALDLDLLIMANNFDLDNPTGIHLRLWLVYNWFASMPDTAAFLFGLGLYEISMDANSWAVKNYSNDIATIFYDNGNTSILYQSGAIGLVILVLKYFQQLRRRFNRSYSIFIITLLSILGMLVPIYETIWHSMVIAMALSGRRQ